MTISIVFGLFLKRLFWGNFTAYFLKGSRIILPYTTDVLLDDVIIAASALTSKILISQLRTARHCGLSSGRVL